MNEISGFVANLAASGILVPDPKLEDYLRDLAGLPPAEHDGQNFGMPPMPGAAGMDMPPTDMVPQPSEEDIEAIPTTPSTTEESNDSTPEVE